MNRVIGVTAAAGGAALVIAGCGTIHAPSGRAARASASPSGAVATASATPRSRADADAAAILASFVPPPGARRLTAAPAAGGGVLSHPAPAPAAGGGVLSHPAPAPASPDVVDDAAWWRVPGTPQAVLAWEKAHLPRTFTASAYGTSGMPPTMWFHNYSLPPVAGVLIQRELAVEAVSAGAGQAALRVDAQVVWLPAKPASERVPDSARVVTISATPGPIMGAKVPAPVTITDAATVRRIASLVDGLPVFPPGRYSCPAELSRAVRMTFRASASGPVLAEVTAGLTGCQGVNVVVGGKPQPALAGGAALARQVLVITGLRWTGYGGGPLRPGSPITPGGVMQHG